MTILIYVTERTFLDRLIGKHLDILLPKPLSPHVNNQCRSSGEPKTWSSGVYEIGEIMLTTPRNVRVILYECKSPDCFLPNGGEPALPERINTYGDSTQPDLLEGLLEDCEWRFRISYSNFQNVRLQFLEIPIAGQMAFMGYNRYLSIYCQ